MRVRQRLVNTMKKSKNMPRPMQPPPILIIQPKNAVNTDKDNSENSPSVKSKTGINQGQPKPAKTAKVNTNDS